MKFKLNKFLKQIGAKISIFYRIVLFLLNRLAIIALCLEEIVFFVGGWKNGNNYEFLALLIPVLIIIIDSVYILFWNKREKTFRW